MAEIMPMIFLAPCANLRLLPSSIDIRPKRTGMFMSGHSGKRDGFHFTNVPNFGGDHLVVVRTGKPEHITIEYNY